MTDPAEWEGSPAGGTKGGKSSVSFSFFLHISISKDPRGWTLSSPFHRKQAGQMRLSPGLWLRRSPKLLRDVWIHSRQETGGTQYWLWWYRSGRGNESIGQTVRTWSLAQRPTPYEQKGEIKQCMRDRKGGCGGESQRKINRDKASESMRERFMISIWFECQTAADINCKMFVLL